MMFLEEIKTKREKLETAKNSLKNHFVGLDIIIDNIFNNFEVWYLMPELLERPIIINLWGMIGTGKTDLVRRIVKELQFEDNFLEIQLSVSQKSWPDKIQDSIRYSGIISESPGILLLDEVQRFRTVDEHGKMISNNDYDDIWQLLSDGTFSDSLREKEKLMELLLSCEYEEEWGKSK